MTDKTNNFKEFAESFLSGTEWFLTGTAAFGGWTSESDVDVVLNINQKQRVLDLIQTSPSFSVEESLYFNGAVITSARPDKPLEVNIIFLEKRDFCVWWHAGKMMRTLPIVWNKTKRHGAFEVLRGLVKTVVDGVGDFSDASPTVLLINHGYPAGNEGRLAMLRMDGNRSPSRTSW